MNAHVLAIVLAASTKKPPPTPVTDTSKAWAIVIGFLALILLYIVTAVLSKRWNPKALVNGFDGFASSSKLQWFLWLIVILFGYAAIWALRALQGDYSALSDIPVNLLTVLGFSTGTAAAAKGITSGYVQAGKVTKAGAPKGEPPKNTGGIFQDDGGAPDLSKIQMMGFTIIAIGIFVATVVHLILSAKTNANLTTSLPNIDPSLMVLMGISQGGYLGKKLVTFGTPALYPASPATGAPGTSVMLRGSNLGSPSASSSQLLLNGAPQIATWSAGSVTFIVPPSDPATSAAWTGLPKAVQLVVSSGGQPSNPVSFNIAAPALESPIPPQGPPRTKVTLAGANLGSPQSSRLLLDGAQQDAQWSTDSVEFTVPDDDPATSAAWTGLPKAVQLVVSSGGQASNTVTFTVVAAPPG
jgi:IPT/TIG domain-containing protein